MRKTALLYFLFLLLIAACTTPRDTEETTYTTDMHNSQNSLDWAGVYEGIIPCASCEGIETKIRINYDLTYEMARVYVGKNDSIFTKEGTFTWTEDGGSIILDNIPEGEAARKYMVGENLLFQLDLDGNRITGELSDRYILRKRTTGVSDVRWILKEIYGNDIAKNYTFREMPHLTLVSEENRMTGNAGCNSFHGHYEITGEDRIAFSEIASTKIACEEMEVETELFNILETVNTFSIHGDTLIINRARMAPLALFVADHSSG